ncbi:hypothetical protein MMC11_001604 [Xylographa trunciseda]|nr:hypothetical protein [Xylographa trunciseda]
MHYKTSSLQPESSSIQTPSETPSEDHTEEHEAHSSLIPGLSKQEAKPHTLKHKEKSSKEAKKVAISRSKSHGFLRSWIYLLPVGITFGILQLSLRQVYWRGTATGDGLPNDTNTVLEFLQIVAKAHEILIVISLSRVILHYLRQQLASPQGLPYGLVTSAYNVALGSQPFSIGFYHACTSIVGRRTFRWELFGLAILTLLATFLGLASGPASAIILIPRADLWYFQDLFVFYQDPSSMSTEDDVTMYIPKALFPNEVNQSSLPGSYCLEKGLDVNGSCPYAGYNDILSNLQFPSASRLPPYPGALGIPDNTTLDTPISRRMTSMPDSLYTASTWTSNQLLGNYMSLGVGLNMHGLDGTPYTVGIRTQYGSVLNPFVRVCCIMQPADQLDRSAPILDDCWNPNQNQDQSGPTFSVTDVWNETVLSNSSTTMFEWVDSVPNTTVPMLTAFIFTPSDMTNTANISVCVVNASWYYDDLWIMSDQSPTIISNFPFSSYAAIAITTDPPPTIRLRKDWADSLNAGESNSTSTVLTDLLDSGMQNYHGIWPQSAQSLILSKVVADGLARIGSEFRVSNATAIAMNDITVCRQGWCSQGPFSYQSQGPMIGNGTWRDYQDISNGGIEDAPHPDSPVLRSFPQPNDIDTAWTRVSFPIERYGYGWGFNSVAIIVAAAVLLFHALVIAIHCCILVFTGYHYKYAATLGELVALALGSQQPATLASTSVGISKGATWKRATAIREVQEEGSKKGRLELVVGESLSEGIEHGLLYRRPVTDKEYE